MRASGVSRLKFALVTCVGRAAHSVNRALSPDLRCFLSIPCDVGHTMPNEFGRSQPSNDPDCLRTLLSETPSDVGGTVKDTLVNEEWRPYQVVASHALRPPDPVGAACPSRPASAAARTWRTEQVAA